MPYNKKVILKTLKGIQDKARMSVTLQKAVSEVAKAVEANDLELAYQISACKSLICGMMQTGRNRQNLFREDDEANKQALGKSVYCLLSGIHFQLAMKINKLSSGMMVFSYSPEGINMQQMKNEGDHFIVRRIKSEKKHIKKEVEELTA